jgi:hypothetical protein
MSPEATDNGKRWGRIPDAIERSGLGRSYLYKLAAEHPGLFRKHGTATVVDFQVLDTILETAPVAQLSNYAV